MIRALAFDLDGPIVDTEGPALPGSSRYDSRLPVITLLHGNESYLIDRAARKLLEELREGLTLEFNYEDLQAETLGADDFAQHVATLPFIDRRRVLVLRDWGLLSGKRQKSGEAERATVALEGIPESTDLVLILHSQVAAGNLLFKVVAAAERQKRAKIERFDAPRPSERAGWVRRFAEERGVSITPAAVRLLLDRVQQELRLLDQEVAKLALYVSPAKRIDEAAVLALGSESREDEIFALTDALAGPRGHAAVVLASMLDAGREPTYLLYLLVQHWRRLLHARAIRDKGETLAAFQGRVSDHPFVLEKAYRQAEAYTGAELDQGFHDLLRLEELIKLGELDARLALEGFILERVLGRQHT